MITINFSLCSKRAFSFLNEKTLKLFDNYLTLSCIFFINNKSIALKRMRYEVNDTML